jgi:hypothetical protein
MLGGENIESMTATLSPGDKWPNHYRGLTLQVSPDGNVWWQLYQGTDRLHLEPAPTDIVDTLLERKRIGGRIHITEGGAALTRVEKGDEYTHVYLGDATIEGTLTPPDNPEYDIEIRPDGLSAGDLWPGVYDGARYSFVDDRLWWQSGSTHRRHPVTTDLPADIIRELQSYKPSGGSFRITPWGDVITLVDMHPAPGTVEAQFAKLPRIVKNIIKLRKERDVEMLPVYVGTIDDPAIEVREPTKLTDELDDDEMEELSSWAQNLGRTTETSTSSHRTSKQSESSNRTSETTDTASSATSSTSDPSRSQTESTSTENNDDQREGTNGQPTSFDDDPIAWIEQEVQPEEDG